MVTLLYFAWVREAIGTGEEQIAVPAGIDTLAQLIDHLASRSEGHAHAFADRNRLRAAIDQQLAPLDSAIGNAREIAFFPPVTGG